jgi:hypothetical protein
MSVVIKVKTGNLETKAGREDLAECVLAEFTDRIPNYRLLCFLDDDDCYALRLELGAANRGLFSPVRERSGSRFVSTTMFWNGLSSK